MAARKRTYSTDPLGPTIERLMTETGTTYRALADKTGLSAGYLNHIVHGNRPVPSTDVLARILCDGVLRVGLRSDYHAFSARNEVGTLTGFEVDLAQAIAHFLGVTLVQVPVASGLNLAAGDFGNWAALPAHAIAPALTWQGTVANAADCSGEFRVAHDRTNVFVEVRVRDDRVVSNIEPNDIKGHWRSDSVELCFDPRTGAEHTLGCYKVGIFPFDTAGTVRAARDADANPGEIAESAPGTRLVSWKTEDGYAIRAMIPFAEIGLRPTKDEREFGFNVLIYDGDKPDAAKGENINRSRLAWSPRPGVQGRPEDWGRARLE